MDRGVRFRALLREHFPWERGERRVARATLLYQYVRNPLSHELALDPQGSRRRVRIQKESLTEDQIQELQKAVSRPSWVAKPLVRRGEQWRVSVPGLYWGVFRLMHQLASDHRQMVIANRKLERRRAY